MFNITDDDKGIKMEFVDSIKFETNLKGLFDICRSNDDNNKNFLAVETNNGEVQVLVLFNNSVYLKLFKKLSTGFQRLQKIIFTQKYLFIIEETGSKIKCFSLYNNNFEYLCDLHRGKKPSNISKIIDLEDNYIAVSSSNGTIHIYKIDLSSQSSNNYYVNLFQKVSNAFFGDGLWSCMKINLKEMLEKEEEGYRNIICNGGSSNEIVCIKC